MDIVRDVSERGAVSHLCSSGPLCCGHSDAGSRLRVWGQGQGSGANAELWEQLEMPLEWVLSKQMKVFYPSAAMGKKLK